MPMTYLIGTREFDEEIGEENTFFDAISYPEYLLAKKCEEYTGVKVKTAEDAVMELKKKGYVVQALIR